MVEREASWPCVMGGHHGGRGGGGGVEYPEGLKNGTAVYRVPRYFSTVITVA
jgi:hypothetical protein